MKIEKRTRDEYEADYDKGKLPRHLRKQVAKTGKQRGKAYNQKGVNQAERFQDAYDGKNKKRFKGK